MKEGALVWEEQHPYGRKLSHQQLVVEEVHNQEEAARCATAGS